MPKKLLHNDFSENLRLLVEVGGSVRVLGIRVRSTEELFQFRLILSASAFFILFISGFIAGKNFLAYSVIFGLIFYILPLEIVKGSIALKARKTLSELPDVIDLMASLLKAGLNLDESILYISKKLDGAVPKLFSIYHTKMLDGCSRSEAYDIAGKLSFCYEFKSFIKILYQSETVGNPVSEILKDLSRVYRNNQRDFLKIRAEKLESNLIIVIFLFIFIPMLALFLIPVLPQLKMMIN